MPPFSFDSFVCPKHTCLNCGGHASYKTSIWCLRCSRNIHSSRNNCRNDTPFDSSPYSHEITPVGRNGFVFSDAISASGPTITSQHTHQHTKISNNIGVCHLHQHNRVIPFPVTLWTRFKVGDIVRVITNALALPLTLSRVPCAELVLDDESHRHPSLWLTEPEIWGVVVSVDRFNEWGDSVECTVQSFKDKTCVRHRHCILAPVLGAEFAPSIYCQLYRYVIAHFKSSVNKIIVLSRIGL